MALAFDTRMSRDARAGQDAHFLLGITMTPRYDRTYVSPDCTRGLTPPPRLSSWTVTIIYCLSSVGVAALAVLLDPLCWAGVAMLSFGSLKEFGLALRGEHGKH